METYEFVIESVRHECLRPALRGWKRFINAYANDILVVSPTRLEGMETRGRARRRRRITDVSDPP